MVINDQLQSGMTNNPGRGTEPIGEPLTVTGLTKRYLGVVAVNDVSLHVGAGEIVGLIGPNGSGKTTFLDCISGIQRANAGRVTLDDRDITGVSSHVLSRKFGLMRTFQAVRIFESVSVRDNMLIGTLGQLPRGLAYRNFLRGRRQWEPERSRVEELIDELNIRHVADLPAGSLSYGQRKLLEMGTALVGQPRVLLLDEPVAAVNPSLANTIRDHIERLADTGITVLLVEHNIELVVGLCHRLVVLDNGQKIAEGPPDAVMGLDRVQEAYFGR